MAFYKSQNICQTIKPTYVNLLHQFDHPRCVNFTMVLSIEKLKHKSDFLLTNTRNYHLP